MGIPHPFDRFRGSLLRDARTGVAGRRSSTGSRPTTRGSSAGRQRAGRRVRARARAARGRGLGRALDARGRRGLHCCLDGDPSTSGGLLAALAGDVELVTGRASYYVRPFTPDREARPAAVATAAIERQGPSADGCGREWTGTVDGDDEPQHAAPGPRAASASTAPAAAAAPARRSRRCDARAGRRATVAGPAAAAAADDHLADPAAHPAVARRPRPAGLRARPDPGPILAARTRLCSSLAFVVFYIGFPLRGLRWAMLLRGTGLRIGIRDATEIIFLSWLVNCLVPAKLGDVYRAYLLKINSPRRRCRGRSARCSSNACSTFRDRGARPRGRASGASGADCRRRVQIVFGDRRRWSWSSSPSGC